MKQKDFVDIMEKEDILKEIGNSFYKYSIVL
jgi:hypothetical protein